MLAEPRLGWPTDGDIAGVYANIEYIGAPAFASSSASSPPTQHGRPSPISTRKDYQGWLTYPSAIALAAETHATHKVLASLPALVHEAHQRGIRVLLRVSRASTIRGRQRASAAWPSQA